MYAGQTLIASQRVYVHKKEIAQQKKRDQEAFKQEIASSMDIAFTEALQEMDMDPTFLAGKYFTGTVSNHKKPSIGFWGQPLDGLKHTPSKSDQARQKQHASVIDHDSQQARQHHDTDLSYAQYVQQNSVEGMWHAQMNQMSEEAFARKSFQSLIHIPSVDSQAQAAQQMATGMALGVKDFMEDLSNLALYGLYVAGHPDVLFSDISKAFNSYWGNAVAVMQDPLAALKNDFDDYQAFANLDLQSQTRRETNFVLGFFSPVGEIGKVAEAGLVGTRSAEQEVIRARVLKNIAESKVARTASNFEVYEAKENQFLGGYNPDRWEMVELKKGTIIYGGRPGQSNFYTDLETVLAARGDKEILGKSLQIEPHPSKGFRSNIGEYEVLKDIRVPGGIVQANPLLGPGETQQYFINNYSKSLILKNEFNLEEFYANRLSPYKFHP